jgi:hypothetical protein
MLVAVATALGLSVELELADRRRSSRIPSIRQRDSVHAAMGEFEAAHLRQLGHHVAIDEPYQHFQFAGRADLVAWDDRRRHLLHLENRTQFPDLQDAAGSFTAKRAYLSAIVADRIGTSRFASETHVMVCLWSAEVLHAIRLHPETFRSIAPDPADPFGAWWSDTPARPGRSSSLVLLDPFATGHRSSWVDLQSALGSARPRYRGYAEAAARLAGSGGKMAS